MAGIRVNTGVKRIEVNDNGEYITLSLNDNDFMDRFFALYENIQKMADEASAKESSIKEKYQGNEIGFTREALSLCSSFGKDMIVEVDGLFGTGTCKKVFGDITPTFDLFIDFFEQLTPFLQDFAAEKKQRMSKYSAARIGNV